MRQRRLGSRHFRGRGEPDWAWALSMLAVSSLACARFGFDRLDPGPDSGIDGRGLTTGGQGGSDLGSSGAGAGTPASGVGGALGPSGAGGSASNPGSGGSAPDTGSGGTTSNPGAGGSLGLSGAGGSGTVPGGPGAGDCADGAQNGDEADVDCGGSSCAPCPCALGALVRLSAPNFSGNDLWSPALSSDGLSLYLGVTAPGRTEQIALSTRADRSAAFGPWQSLSPPVNQSTEGTPYVSADGLSLYFYSRRTGGRGNRDLYVATRGNTADDFGNVTALSGLNGTGMDNLARLSGDQLTIYFASDRSGDVDIWRSTRSSIGAPFDAPRAVTELNTPSDEGGLALSSDGLELILTSNRPGGSGARDLYRAIRASTSEPFSTPEPIEQLNTPDNEIDPALSADGTELYFSSNRGGGTSGLYRALRTCPR